VLLSVVELFCCLASVWLIDAPHPRPRLEKARSSQLLCLRDASAVSFLIAIIYAIGTVSIVVRWMCTAYLWCTTEVPPTMPTTHELMTLGAGCRLDLWLQM